jgi:hypothetical protein
MVFEITPSFYLTLTVFLSRLGARATGTILQMGSVYIFQFFVTHVFQWPILSVQQMRINRFYFAPQVDVGFTGWLQCKGADSKQQPPQSDLHGAADAHKKVTSTNVDWIGHSILLARVVLGSRSGWADETRVASCFFFHTKNPNLGMYILEGLGKEKCKLYAHLQYFKAVWYIVCSYGVFSPFWYVVPRKI